jgi:nitrate/nitrite transporter NarK
MINYIGVFGAGIFIGFLIGMFLRHYYAVIAEENRQSDIASGMPIASELAREMRIKLDSYEERELWV